MMLPGKLGTMMKKAQEMQENMQKMQAELANRHIVGIAGAGAVKVTLNGHYACQRVELSEEALKEDKETSLFIKKLLIRLKLAPDNIEISYLFRSEYQNFTYFFYVKDNSSVEILRHDIEKRQWFVGGYSASPSIDDNMIKAERNTQEKELSTPPANQ